MTNLEKLLDRNSKTELEASIEEIYLLKNKLFELYKRNIEIIDNINYYKNEYKINKNLYNIIEYNFYSKSLINNENKIERLEREIIFLEEVINKLEDEYLPF